MKLFLPLTRILAAAAFGLALVPTSRACGYDGLVGELSAAHPESLVVAFALHDALLRDDLKPLPTLLPVFGLLRANRLAKDFGDQVKQIAGTADGSAAVLLVESGLWTRYRFRSGGVDVELHVTGPGERETVIITSEAALKSMLDGRLSIERGMEMALMRIVAPQGT